jgi:hypothetical protein
MTADAGSGESPQVMRVSTELVLEQLVSRVLDRTLELQSADPSPDADQVLGMGPEPPELARLGYAGREAETEIFEPARQPMPWLAEMLEARVRSGGNRVEAIATVCRDLSAEEPDGKPDPGEGSWRVPGPGGHVRHYLALAATDELTHADSNGDPAVRRELSAGEAKRCFLFGFYARCCEEALG